MTDTETEKAVQHALALLGDLDSILKRPKPSIGSLRELGLALEEALEVNPPTLDTYLDAHMFLLRHFLQGKPYMDAIRHMMQASAYLEVEPPNPYPGVVRHALLEEGLDWQRQVLQQKMFFSWMSLYQLSIGGHDREGVLEWLDKLRKGASAGYEPGVRPARFTSAMQQVFNDTELDLVALEIPIGLDENGERTDFAFLSKLGDEEGYLTGFER